LVSESVLPMAGSAKAQAAVDGIRLARSETVMVGHLSKRRRTSAGEAASAARRDATLPRGESRGLAVRRFSSIVPSIGGRMAPWTMPAAGVTFPRAGPA
jgi:hypothetical protein